MSKEIQAENKEENLDKKIKKEKRKYHLTSTGFRQRIEQNLDDNEHLIKKFKDEIISQGINIIFDIEKSLNKLDVDNSGKIDIDEFNRICSEHNINLIPDEIKTLFACFDPSRTGRIFYQDILNLIYGQLNDFRENLVDELYNNLEKNNISNIDIKTVLSSFVKNNIKKETLEELKDNFISHHEFYGKGRTDITYDEFINFFEILSLNYPTDNDFENFIKNSFNPNLEENIEEEPKEEIKVEEVKKEPTV
jgi:Ca2+-binding EF-hand superfamily protein